MTSVESPLVAAHPLRAVIETHWTPDPGLVSKKPPHNLSYVGHADVNRTLTELDPDWSWEPLAFDDDGAPKIISRDKADVLWGRLTLHGKTVLCVGSCDPNKVDVDKELVGDLIRNGAMRHNVYGALWSKAERDGTEERTEPAERRSGPQNRSGGRPASEAQIKFATTLLKDVVQPAAQLAVIEQHARRLASIDDLDQLQSHEISPLIEWLKEQKKAGVTPESVPDGVPDFMDEPAHDGPPRPARTTK